MSRDLFYKVLHETLNITRARPASVVALSYGGESLLHPDFKEFAEAFCKTGIKRRQLATNAVLLDAPERIQVLIDNFSEVALSIHNVPQLPEVLENVRAVVAQMKATKPLALRANIVEEEFRTHYGLQKVVQQLKEIGIEIKVFSAITEDMSRYLDDTKLRPEVCFSPYWYMGILWNGDVLPCCHVLSAGTWTMGNVSSRSLREVFEDEPYRNLRAGFYEGTLCERCTVRA